MATESATENQVAIPPYIPFPTVAGFIDRLKETTVPTAIDKSMMNHIAGGLQSYLLAALRFLGLTEGKGNTVTPELEKLVESVGTEGYKGTLAAIINSAYAGLIGEIDLAKATDKQLNDAFARCKLDGVARERAIRFYLKGLTTAGITYSPHLGQRKPRGTSNNGTQRTRNRAATSTPDQPNAANRGGASGGASAETPKPADKMPAGVIEFPIPIGDGACIRVPATITTKDMPVVQAILQIVEAMANRNSSDEKK